MIRLQIDSEYITFSKTIKRIIESRFGYRKLKSIFAKIL